MAFAEKKAAPKEKGPDGGKQVIKSGTPNPPTNGGTLVITPPEDLRLPESETPGQPPLAETTHVSASEAQRKAIYDDIPKERREWIETNGTNPFPPANDRRALLLEEAYTQYVAANGYEGQGNHDYAGAAREYEDDILAELARKTRRAERSDANRAF
jgi:hypothetical protein